MLKKIILIMVFVFSLPALACWRVEGTLGVDGETFKFDQKFEHQKDYSLPLGVFILNLKFSHGKNKKHSVEYKLHEKKDNKLILITKGKESLKEGKSEDIYAKGEPGQPHSIITIKITNI